MSYKTEEKPTSFQLTEQFHLLRFLFSFTKDHWWRFVISIGLMVVASIITARLPIIIQTFLDDYVQTESATYHIALRAALIYFMLIFIRLIVVYIKDFLFQTGSELTVRDLRTTIYQKLSYLNLSFFHRVPSGEIVSRVTNDTETIKEFWRVFLTFFDGIINATIVAIAMYSLNVYMANVFMAFIPIVLLLIYVYQKYSTIVYRKMRSALGRVNARLSESTAGMWLIQQFNQTQRMADEFETINQEYVDARIRMFKMDALLLNPAVNLIETMVLVLVIWIFGAQFLNGYDMDLGLVYAFTAYTKSFFRPIGMMLGSLNIYQDGLVAASRGKKLLSSEELMPEQIGDADLTALIGDVKVEDVTFSYDGKVNALKDFNLSARPGEMVALIGHTGSGKSTMINLLMHFYKVDEGDIYYDDASITSLTYDVLRENVSLVQQDAFMFYGTIRNNIRLHGNYTDEEVEAAAEFTGANKFIERLPEGYDTLITEGGTSLSAGQKQLINISRSVLRKPKVLILDEATANMDTESELYIQESLKKIRQNATLIVIAHRLSTIRDADRIYVLKKGQLKEVGNHDTLIAKEGIYYKMYQLQSIEQLT